ncbi:hypothetical protein A2U01_0019487, partial [Trifolium medium]|nr:hypothetical protein [Trifolium medium]
MWWSNEVVAYWFGRTVALLPAERDIWTVGFSGRMIGEWWG